MMKKSIYLSLFLFFVNFLNAQEIDCSNMKSDDLCLRYTASGCQEVVNGNHSKAINESRKIANICAECELAKMINSAVTRVVETMDEENQDYLYQSIDTILVSSYKMFRGMKTICQSETKLINNTYVTHITKEISYDNISDMFDFHNEKDKKKFKKNIVKITN